VLDCIFQYIIYSNQHNGLESIKLQYVPEASCFLLQFSVYHSEDFYYNVKRSCSCIQRCLGMERVMDVVPRGTEFETFGIRWRVWEGCTRSAIIATANLLSSSFIQTLSSPFSDALKLEIQHKAATVHTLPHTWPA
jgi:hypothetical protein